MTAPELHRQRREDRTLQGPASRVGVQPGSHPVTETNKIDRFRYPCAVCTPTPASSANGIKAPGTTLTSGSAQQCRALGADEPNLVPPDGDRAGPCRSQVNQHRSIQPITQLVRIATAAGAQGAPAPHPRCRRSLSSSSREVLEEALDERRGDGRQGERSSVGTPVRDGRAGCA